MFCVDLAAASAKLRTNPRRANAVYQKWVATTLGGPAVPLTNAVSSTT